MPVPNLPSITSIRPVSAPGPSQVDDGNIIIAERERDRKSELIQEREETIHGRNRLVVEFHTGVETSDYLPQIYIDEEHTVPPEASNFPHPQY